MSYFRSMGAVPPLTVEPLRSRTLEPALTVRTVETQPTIRTATLPPRIVAYPTPPKATLPTIRRAPAPAPTLSTRTPTGPTPIQTTLATPKLRPVSSTVAVVTEPSPTLPAVTIPTAPAPSASSYGSGRGASMPAYTEFEDLSPEDIAVPDAPAEGKKGLGPLAVLGIVGAGAVAIWLALKG